MSRMTKFLKQKCQIEAYLVNENGVPETNRFGELQYYEPTIHKCRHEICFKDVQTSNGSIVKSASRYFLDESVNLKADYRIDGHVILAVESYINEVGKLEGYEAYV